ncbi:hypothetical protein BSFA1_84590 (plasmid) [Burkholderia sp. SFA1]|nr:hypothetical protein BYI23_E000400 [Burkholderia sp. YI23]BBQ03331.1 hypothetical protein BSFA1_84590 [Burkholderia sp. SFA1]
MSSQRVNARDFAASGQHDHIATLQSGLHFHGIYVLREKPEIATVGGEQCFSFWIADLTGRMRCTIPTYKLAWHDSPEFQSQRLLIEAYAEGEGAYLVGRVKRMDPVEMDW